MAEKPGYNVASGFNGGVTVGINADNWEQFVYLCEQAYPGNGELVARGLYGNLLSQSGLTQVNTEARAVDVLQSQLGAVAVPPAPQYAQSPQQYQQQPPVYQQAPPVQAQNGPPPGQTCDPSDPTKTKWVPPGHSNKTGRDYPGFWAKP